MIVTQLEKPLKLAYYHAMENRYQLCAQQSSDFWTTNQGYLGELDFLMLLRDFPEVLIAWNLTLTAPVHGASQFDVLILYGNRLIHYDVKNFQGIYRLDGNQLLNGSGKSIKHPQPQLDRAHQVMSHFVDRTDYHLESYVVFINPDFRLDAASPSDQWLFYGQIKHHLKRFAKPNYRRDDNMQMAQHLISMNKPLSHLNQPIRTDFGLIKGGLKCPNCLARYELEEMAGNKKVYCHKCRTGHFFKDILTHNLKEFYYLKGEPFSLAEAQKFCGVGGRSSTYNRCFTEHFKKIGQNKGTKYYLPDVF